MNVKILLAYHKESELIQSEIMMPIQVGAKNCTLDLNLQRDDEGENISEKNNRYCELTAQYWAWKNLDADYYGLMHYRRHFAFRDITYPYDDGEPVCFSCISDEYKEKIGLKDEAIYHCIERCDLILPLPVDMHSFGAISNEVQFSCMENLHAVDFDIVCRIVTELYPDYGEAVQEFRTGRFAYWYNMFVMKRELFMEYSQWLFRILDAAEEKIDFSQYDQQEIRTLAFMAERLLSIFVIKLLKDRPDLNLKHLKMTFVRNTDLSTNDNGRDTEPLKKCTPQMEYASSVEKAYRELLSLPLPYDMESLFLTKDHPLSTLLQEKTVMFYGGGNWCIQLLAYFDRLGIPYPTEIWDRDAEEGQTLHGVPIVKPDFASVSEGKNVLWVITVYNQSVSNTIKRLFYNHGVTDVIDNRTLIKWLSYQLWLCVKNEAARGDVNENP